MENLTKHSGRFGSLLAPGIVFGLILTANVSAGPLVDPVNKDRGGVALKRYDPVAYFREEKPVKGSGEFIYEWMGAVWWFSSAGNRDTFAASPERYAPQYGGYCAWAVSQGYTADVDPEAWRIVGGKLYLNYSKSVQRKWERDTPMRIQEGDRNWSSLHK